MNILVAYGSRYGSTRGTASHIAEELVARGETVDLMEASSSREVHGYDLIIVGSGIYVGRLRLRIVRLLNRIARHSPETPVALFGQGPISAQDERPEEWELARRLVAKAGAHVAGLRLVSSTVFGGVVDPDRMPKLLSGVGAVDRRDWEAIDEWVDLVLREVAAAPVR